MTISAGILSGICLLDVLLLLGSYLTYRRVLLLQKECEKIDAGV
jgi:hypothetical protein